MNWIDSELADFGRRIGLPDLRLGEHGTCQLRLESGDHLAVDVLDDDVIVYRRHALPWPDADGLLRALQRCNLRDGGQPFQIGLRGAGAELVIAARLPARAFTAQRLESTWDGIGQWIEQWTAQGR